MVGARVLPWPRYESRCVDGAPPLLDSPSCAGGRTVPSSNSANRRMTELATSLGLTPTNLTTRAAESRDGPAPVKGKLAALVACGDP